MKKTTQKVSADKSEPALEQNALAHFSAKRYKEATDLYKDLLKRSDNAFYRQQLAQCYLQRVLGMSAKGMPKEAIILWENYAEWAKPPLAALDSYILWLLAAKNNRKAIAKLEQLTAQQLDENFPELAVWLGFLMISSYPEIAGHIPQDSALVAHFGLVQEALNAYRNQQTECIDETLKKLPFRSAFRDLRSLLKAQLVSAVSVEQMQTLLSKIPAQSPYRPVADALLAYTLQGASFVDTALKLDNNQRRLVARAKGLSNKQTELLEHLYKLQGHQTDKSRFNLAIEYKALFGTEVAQGYCQGMLANFPAGRKDFLKNFDSIDTFEENRIQALLCEQGRDSYDALFYWRQCINALHNNKNSENYQRIALILRHMSVGLSHKKTIDLIIESLDYDPGDRDSYLKILNFYDQHQPDATEYERWLELSLRGFPGDADLLVRAAKSAAGRKAFKKASKYAQDLLKIDPVNTLAKQLLFASHLAHARRLIKTKKFHLVDKEILAAERLTVNKSLRRLADLMRGFKVWAADDAKLGLEMISDVLRKLNGDPINMQFQAFMETSLLELPVAPITQFLPPGKDHLLSAPELSRLIELIKYYDEQISDYKILFNALDKIKTPVKKSIQQQNYHEDALLAWCRILEHIGHFELLKHCSKLAHAKWQRPIWVYYLIYADNRGDPTRLDFMTMLKLKNASEAARAENDQKTAFLIGSFIERSLGNQSPFDFDFDDGVNAIDEEEFTPDIFSALFGHIPDSIMDKIDRKAEAIIIKTNPERCIADYIRKFGQTSNQRNLEKLFMNPDFFSAVVILDAANELRIDIGVQFEDIVYRFQNDTPQQSLPFF